MQYLSKRSTRRSAVDHLYNAMAHLMRRRSELAGSMHPQLSLVGYTFLSEIAAASEMRAIDLAALFGLDKSTVSRQLDALEAAGLIQRQGERPGRRGYSLMVTAKGEAALEQEAAGVRDRLVVALARWNVAEITAFAEMLDRFIEDVH